MESHNVEVLLDRYFEGETTLVEESQLRDYFTGDAVAPYLEEYVAMFGAFSTAQKETYDRPILMPRSTKPYYRYIAGAAAAVIIGFMLWTQQTHVDNSVTTTYENEELAILKTKQALGMMSQMISNSTTQLEVVEEFDRASSALF